MSLNRRCIAAVLASFCLSAANLRASPQPLEEAWAELDGPQPRGPGEVLLVDHQPNNSGGLTSDSMGFEKPGAPVVYQFVADNFATTLTTSVRRMVFWGFYNSNVEPTIDEMFRVRFYNSRPGDQLPGTMLHEESFLNVARAWTGRNVISAAGGKEYFFEVLLNQPFAVEAGSQYWLEIAQIGDPASSFRWEDSVDSQPNGVAYRNDAFTNWGLTAYFPVNPDAAYQLYSIPEPSSFCFAAMALPFFLRLRDAPAAACPDQARCRL